MEQEVVMTFSIHKDGTITQSLADGTTRVVREMSAAPQPDGIILIKTVEAKREILRKDVEEKGFGIETVEVETIVITPKAQIPQSKPPVPVALDPEAAANMGDYIPKVGEATA